MTAAELSAAILATEDMLSRCGLKAPRYPLLLEHLKRLLKEQEKRATMPQPAPMPLNPVAPYLNPPWIVTCGDKTGM